MANVHPGPTCWWLLKGTAKPPDIPSFLSTRLLLGGKGGGQTERKDAWWFFFFKQKEKGHTPCDTDLLQEAKCPVTGTRGNEVKRKACKTMPRYNRPRAKERKKLRSKHVCAYVCINIHTMSSLNPVKVCTPSPWWLARARVPEEWL